MLSRKSILLGILVSFVFVFVVVQKSFNYKDVPSSLGRKMVSWIKPVRVLADDGGYMTSRPNGADIAPTGDGRRPNVDDTRRTIDDDGSGMASKSNEDDSAMYRDDSRTIDVDRRTNADSGVLTENDSKVITATNEQKQIDSAQEGTLIDSQHDSRYGPCVCHNRNVENEQFHQYWRNTIGLADDAIFRYDEISKYMKRPRGNSSHDCLTYNYTVKVITTYSNAIVIHIDETYVVGPEVERSATAKSTDRKCPRLGPKSEQSVQNVLGGASFFTPIIGNNTKAMCPFIDHFNGSYTVCCPRLANSNITIILAYTNFAAFRGPGNFNDSYTIFTQIVTLKESQSRDNENHVTRDPDAGDSTKRPECASSKTLPYWSKVSSRWRWMEDDVDTTWTSERTLQCLASFPGDIHIMGDSHMRLVFEYFLYIQHRMSEALATKFRTNKSVGRFKFHWCQEGEDVLSALQRFNVTTLKRADEKPVLVYFGFGAWCNRLSLFQFLQETKAIWRETIRRLQAHSMTFAFQTVPNTMGYNRSQFNYALTGQVMGRFFEDVGVYSTYSWEKSILDANHMLLHHHMLKVKAKFVKGDAGLSVIHDAFRHICTT